MSKFKVGDLVKELPGSNTIHCITSGNWVGEVESIAPDGTFHARTRVPSDTEYGKTEDSLGRIWGGLEMRYFELVPNPITSVGGCTVALEHATIEQLEAALKAKALVRIAELRKYT